MTPLIAIVCFVAGLQCGSALAREPIYVDAAYTMRPCAACETMTARLRADGQRVDIKRIADPRLKQYPTVIYSDGRYDFGARISRGEITTRTQAVRIYEWQAAASRQKRSR